jgi:hypothetical protein
MNIINMKKQDKNLKKNNKSQKTEGILKEESILKKESLDAIIKNNTEERKSKFLHYVVIIRYIIAISFLFAGIMLRYVNEKWKELSSALIIISALMLFVATIRLISKPNLPIGEKALLSEIQSERLAISLFFLYIFVMLGSYFFRPANLDFYFVLGYGAAIIPVSYIVSYRFFYNAK